MAIVILSSAFDYRDTDLQGVLNGSTNILVEAASPQLLPGIGMTIGAVNHIIASQAIFPDVHVRREVTTVADFDFWGQQAASVAHPQGVLLRMAGAWSPIGNVIDIKGFTLDAARFFAAGATASTVDDLEMWRLIFRGNDYVGGASADDVMLLGAGDDIYFDGGGQDEVYCGPGNDLAMIGNQNGGVYDDFAVGAQGNDILHNMYGQARMWGNEGADTLIGAYGNDTMVGGAGADVFVFQADFGTHRVLDFDAAVDRIVVPEGATSLGDLTITQLTGRVRIESGNWTLILRNADASTLNSGNVLFDGLDYSEAVRNAFLSGYAYDA